MSRAIAIALLLLLTSSLAEPYFLAGLTSVPDCCRRDGKHHCSMMNAGTEGIGLTATAQKCPLYPRSTAVPGSREVLAPRATQIATLLYSHPSAGAQTTVRYHIAHCRSRQKRGPPSTLSA